MSSSFDNSDDQFHGDSPSADTTHPFADDYLGTLNSESPQPIYVSGAAFSSDPVDFSSEISVNSPILPPPSEMEREESFALGEWRRKNAIRLEEKEKIEKELLGQIIVEANEYKFECQKKRQITCETNRAINREKEKVLVAIQDKFHAEADKDYWKSIAELIPKEVPAIEKRKGKKEQENKPSIVVVQGPKSGKPTDLARMRHILVKLKHDTPPHLKLSPPAAAHAKTDSSAATKTTAIEVVASSY